VFEQHATDDRLTRNIGMPSERISYAGDRLTTVFDDGQG
jgi:hypothetical protein